MKLRTLTALFGLVAAVVCHANVPFIARLADGADAYQVGAVHRVGVLEQTDQAPFVLFDAPDQASATAARALMAFDPNVIWTEDNVNLAAPEGQRKGSTLPAVGDRTSNLNANRDALSQINWNSSIASAPGRTVKVAILDTGLSPYAGSVWNKVIASENFVEAGAPAYDVPQNTDSNGDGLFDQMTGHGTMVAGIIDQVSPQSQFVVARVADSDGNSSTWRLIKGVAFAAVNGAELANVSLGTLTRIPAMTDVLDWSSTRNLTVVAAIGNNGVNDACSPARIRNAICVAGVTASNTKCSFSNWDGVCLVSAPAEGICSTDWTGGMGVWSGTSFSTPFVTGSLAEMLRRNGPRGDSSRLSSALKSTVTDISKQNPLYKSRLGGLLNVAKLMTQARAR